MSFIIRDRKFRLRRITRQTVEFDHVWEVTFEMGATTGTARHKRFSCAVIQGAVETLRNVWEVDRRTGGRV